MRIHESELKLVRRYQRKIYSNSFFTVKKYLDKAETKSRRRVIYTSQFQIQIQFQFEFGWQNVPAHQQTS